MIRQKRFADKCAIVIAVSIISIMLGASASLGNQPGGPDKMQGKMDPDKMDNARKAEEAQRFNEHKQQMLRQIGERIGEMQSRIGDMQKKQSCVQSAADREALRGCFPGGGPGGGQGGGKWGHGGEHNKDQH
jgi:hypothetical protein